MIKDLDTSLSDYIFDKTKGDRQHEAYALYYLIGYLQVKSGVTDKQLINILESAKHKFWEVD